jgi:hypothetical protein
LTAKRIIRPRTLRLVEKWPFRRYCSLHPEFGRVVLVAEKQAHEDRPPRKVDLNRTMLLAEEHDEGRNEENTVDGRYIRG